MSQGVLVAAAVGLFFFGTRLWSLRKRLGLPRFWGGAYFFSVPVGEGFYRGDGAPVLRWYRNRLLASFATEAAAILLAAWLFGWTGFVVTALIGSALLAFSMQRITAEAIRRARAHELPGAPPPGQSAAVTSLQPRRLSGYTDKVTEAVILVMVAGSVVLLAYAKAQHPWANWRELLLFPAVMLYLQLGVVLLKSGIVAWRTPLPEQDAERHLQLKEEGRRYLLRVCDWMRLIGAFFLAHAAVKAAFGDEWATGTARAVVWTSLLGLAVILLITMHRESRRILELARQVAPARNTTIGGCPPTSGRFAAGGLFYYGPDNPSLLVRGPRGFTFNFADQRTYYFLGYFAGLAALALASLR